MPHILSPWISIRNWKSSEFSQINSHSCKSLVNNQWAIIIVRCSFIYIQYLEWRIQFIPGITLPAIQEIIWAVLYSEVKIDPSIFCKSWKFPNPYKEPISLSQSNLKSACRVIVDKSEVNIIANCHKVHRTKHCVLRKYPKIQLKTCHIWIILIIYRS
jgi:hypothetical protein